MTIIAFEAMAISTAMPIIARDLDAVRSYGLAFSAMLTTQLLGIVLAGVWCDRRGPLPSLFAGQALMAAGTALAGLAPTFLVLLAGRLVAGLGAGLLTVAIYVVIGRAYPEALRPRVFSWISAAWVLPSLVGPPIAGWLAETFSWRWVFLVVVVPVAVTMVVVASRHETMRDDSDSELSPTPVAEQRRLVSSGSSSRWPPARCSGAPRASCPCGSCRWSPPSPASPGCWPPARGWCPAAPCGWRGGCRR